MKWDNCLVSWPGGEAEPPRMVFVDWELADVGDPCWDVGALIQAYLAAWITSVPQAPGVPLRQLAQTASAPLDRFQPAIGALWHRYATDRGLDADSRARTLDRCVRAAGARMIQTAYESLTEADSVAPHVSLLLQVSLNILTRPGEAAGQLLALD
jgi:aminoglycoside phosphotransferase (APT) family kinase protein